MGDERARFLYRGANEYGNACGNKMYFTCAVALVFATDKDKSSGTYSNFQFKWFFILLFIQLHIVKQ